MQYFNLCLDTPGDYILYAKQGDSHSRFFRVVLSDGGMAYEPPAGASFTVRYGCPGMPLGWYDTIALEDGTERAAIVQEGNMLTVELAPQMLAIPGENHLCLLIHGAEEYQLATWNFRVKIEGDPNPDATAWDGYYNISTATLSKVADHVGNTSNPHNVTIEQIGAAPATESTTYTGCYYRTVNGVQEWLNPPLLAGVEYRTTERLKGAPVYAYHMEFNAIGGNELYFTPPLLFTAGLVRMEGRFYSENETYVYAFPSNEISFRYTPNGYVICSNGVDITGFNGSINFYYVK